MSHGNTKFISVTFTNCSRSFWVVFLFTLESKLLHRNLHDSVMKCLTRNPGDLGSTNTGFFMGVSLGKTLQRDSLSTDETQERHELCELSSYD